jgi:hypothetical protein
LRPNSKFRASRPMFLVFLIRFYYYYQVTDKCTLYPKLLPCGRRRACAGAPPPSLLEAAPASPSPPPPPAKTSGQSLGGRRRWSPSQSAVVPWRRRSFVGSPAVGA